MYFESQSCVGLICGLFSPVPCLCPWRFQVFQKEMRGILQKAAPEEALGRLGFLTLVTDCLIFCGTWVSVSSEQH